MADLFRYKGFPHSDPVKAERAVSSYPEMRLAKGATLRKRNPSINVPHCLREAGRFARAREEMGMVKGCNFDERVNGGKEDVRGQGGNLIVFARTVCPPDMSPTTASPESCCSGSPRSSSDMSAALGSPSNRSSWSSRSSRTSDTCSNMSSTRSLKRKKAARGESLRQMRQRFSNEELRKEMDWGVQLYLAGRLPAQRHSKSPPSSPKSQNSTGPTTIGFVP